MLHSHQLVFIVLAWSVQKALGGEIIKGREVPASKMKYMASVQDDGCHICGGFLIAKNIVLTAAHCKIKDVSMLSVVLGTNDLDRFNKKTRRYNIKKICQHHAYDNITYGNDIMMLTLAEMSKIKPIKLPKKNTKLKDNTRCLVAGWGNIKTNGPSARKLMEVDVSTINPTICEKKWSHKGQHKKNLPDNIICAGGYDTDKGFCQGDSGGPLVCNKMAFGIVSFTGHTCDYPHLPNVYTKIANFIDWINEGKCKND